MMSFSFSSLNALVRYGSTVVQKWWWALGAAAFVFYNILNSHYLWKLRKTIKRDIKGLLMVIRLKMALRKRLRSDQPLHKLFLEQLRKNPNKIACIEVETGKQLTFLELNSLANKYANFIEAEGLKKGDVVVLYMENCIEYIAIWMGLSKIGVVTAFINSNLKMEPLAHSIRVANSKKIITSSALLPSLNAVFEADLLSKGEQIFLNSGESNEHCVLDRILEDVSDEEPEDKGVRFQDVLCYIYTSGTTGNPKPAIVKHYRAFFMSLGSCEICNLSDKDTVYLTLPLYHTAAGIMGVCTMFIRGSTLIIRKKFSASNFWKDCVKYNCTAVAYIGEICRYLLAQKPTEEEKQHKVRAMYGAGLRQELWSEFVRRFGIKQIGESFGSTEGNSNITNIDGHVGACGFLPTYSFIKYIHPVRLIKVDEASQDVIRDPKTGLCVSCAPGDTGEMVGLIKKEDLMMNFEGYVNKGDSQKKVYQNVFSKGDQYFASGDILYWDELGYLYFKDRRGDTFRWKGENVSTTEVEKILQPLMSLEDATVYGVQVGKMEGRAGMAAIVLKPNVDEEELLQEIGQKLTANLAAYAVPVFIRLSKELDRTGTFKLKKVELQKQGYNLESCKGDKIFYWNVATKKYERLTEQMRQDIETGAYTKI